MRLYPECIDILNRYGMPCQGCMGADTGTIEEGAIMHDVDIEKLLAELNLCRKVRTEQT